MRVLIYEVRMEVGLSINDLVLMTKYSETSIRDYENNKTLPPLDKLTVIAHAMGHNVTDLIEDSKFPYNNSVYNAQIKINK